MKLRKIAVGVISMLLLTSCGNTDKAKKEDAVSKSNVSKQLYSMQIDSSYDKNSEEYYSFYITRQQQDLYEVRGQIGNTFYSNSEMESATSYGTVTAERIDKIVELINDSNPTYYEPTHANEDGVMVTEYANNTVVMSYQFYDENNKMLSSKDLEDLSEDERKNMSGYFELSDENYQSLLNECIDLHNAVIKARQNQN